MAKDLSYLHGWIKIKDRELRANNYGFINEAAILAPGGLAMLAEYKISPKDLPIPDRDIAKEYWEEVLKPQMQTT